MSVDIERTEIYREEMGPFFVEGLELPQHRTVVVATDVPWSPLEITFYENGRLKYMAHLGPEAIKAIVNHFK